jgi:hypothetical protein
MYILKELELRNNEHASIQIRDGSGLGAVIQLSSLTFSISYSVNHISVLTAFQKQRC